MEWQTFLLLWIPIATILATIIRATSGDRKSAWDGYGDVINDGEEGCVLGVIGSAVLLPGVIAIAIWDWLLGPCGFWFGKKAGNARRAIAFKEALKHLPPFERQCYDKILELREHRDELQNFLHDQENDDDPATPTPETLKRVNNQLEAIHEAENKLWEQVSSLPMSDLPVQQRIAKANESVRKAEQLLATANDPDVQLLRGNLSTVSPEEDEKARAELRQR